MAVAVDAVTSSKGASVSSLTWAHTVNGSERCLVVGVSYNSGASRNVSSVTYNGVTMTSAGTAPFESSGNNECALFYLVNPDLGTNNIVVTMNASVNELFGGGISLTGVDQASPVGTYASRTFAASSTSLSVTGLADGIIVDTICMSATPTPTLTVGASQTERWNLQNSTNFPRGGGSTRVATGATTMDWSFGASAFGAQAALPMRASTAVAAGGQMMMRSGS